MSKIFNIEKLSKYINYIITIKYSNGELFYDGLFTKITDKYIFLKDLETELDIAISVNEFYDMSKYIYLYNPKTTFPIQFGTEYMLKDVSYNLKLCPLCEGRTEVSRINGTTKAWFAIRCTDCGLQTPHIFTTEKDAVDFWNRRKECGNE